MKFGENEMNPQEKIYRVLKKIKDKSEISPNSNIIVFDFCYVLGPYVFADDEKLLLKKFEKEGIIKIDFYSTFGDIKGIDKESMYKSTKSIYIKLLPGFDEYYAKYKQVNSKKDNNTNFWQYTNPFYLIFLCLQFIWRNKIISLIVTVLLTILTFLAYDYKLVSDNAKLLIDFLVKIFLGLKN